MGTRKTLSSHCPNEGEEPKGARGGEWKQTVALEWQEGRGVLGMIPDSRTHLEGFTEPRDSY